MNLLLISGKCSMSDYGVPGNVDNSSNEEQGDKWETQVSAYILYIAFPVVVSVYFMEIWPRLKPYPLYCGLNSLICRKSLPVPPSVLLQTFDCNM